jgi:type IV secretion system protein TrbL
MGSAASTAYTLGQEAAGSSSVSAGLTGIARAAGSAMRQRASAALGVGEAAESGRAAAWSALAGRSASGAADPSGEATPAWARQLRRQQDARHHRHVAVQALREGDRGGAGATPDISEKED